MRTFLLLVAAVLSAGCGKSFVEAQAIYEDEQRELKSIERELGEELTAETDKLRLAAADERLQAIARRETIISEWNTLHPSREDDARSEFSSMIKEFDEKHGIANGNIEAYNVPVDVGKQRAKLIDVFEATMKAESEKRVAERNAFVDRRCGEIPSGEPDLKLVKDRLERVRNKFESALAEQRKKVDTAAKDKEAAKR